MALQLSVAVRNARLDAFESTTGTSAKLRLFTGSVPANCGSADPAGQIAELTLPADWMNAAGSGQKTLLGTWTGTASGSGTAISFRIKDSAGTTCHLQGTVGLGSGDLSLDNNVIANGQTINITTFTLNDANA
jgi:hypothetical protein